MQIQYILFILYNELLFLLVFFLYNNLNDIKMSEVVLSKKT